MSLWCRRRSAFWLEIAQFVHLPLIGVEISPIELCDEPERTINSIFINCIVWWQERYHLQLRKYHISIAQQQLCVNCAIFSSVVYSLLMAL